MSYGRPNPMRGKKRGERLSMGEYNGDPYAVPKALKKFRQEADLSQRQVADVLGMSTRTLMRWENCETKYIDGTNPTQDRFLCGMRDYIDGGPWPWPFRRSARGEVVLDPRYAWWNPFEEDAFDEPDYYIPIWDRPKRGAPSADPFDF